MLQPQDVKLMKMEMDLIVPDESTLQRVTRVAAYKDGIDFETRATYIPGFCWEAPRARKGASPQHWQVHNLNTLQLLVEIDADKEIVREANCQETSVVRKLRWFPNKEIVVYGICVQLLPRGTHDKEESVTVVHPITEIPSNFTALTDLDECLAGIVSRMLTR